MRRAKGAASSLRSPSWVFNWEPSRRAVILTFLRFIQGVGVGGEWGGSVLLSMECYSGASLGFQLSSVIAGGPAPLIATWLYGQFQSAYAIAAYILVCAVITIISAALMTDYTGKDIEGE
jgi:MFS family permease